MADRLQTTHVGCDDAEIQLFTANAKRTGVRGQTRAAATYLGAVDRGYNITYLASLTTSGC